jgi:hypothetical protein
MVHNDTPAQAREVVRLTDEIHLDIAHQPSQEYRDTRRLRIHPWAGPVLNSCKILYDPQHFMDFVQASVRGQFDRPDHVYERARAQLDRSREIWFSLQDLPQAESAVFVKEYLAAVGGAANAVASLSGSPLAERRLLIDFPRRAEALRRPGLMAGLLGLLGAPNFKINYLSGWLEDWKNAFLTERAEQALVRFHPARLNYYRAAFTTIAESEQPLALLWPLLNTWTDLAELLPQESPSRGAWLAAFEKLGLYGKTQAERIRALDAYLDLVEETLEGWAQENGAWEPVG